MEELILSVLSIRTPARQEQIMSLVATLSDSDFGEDLFGLYQIAESADSSFDIIDSFEGHIFKLMDEFLTRMGLTVDYTTMINSPYKIVWILELLDALEGFEDVDGILAITSSEEDELIILNNLLHFVNPEANSDFTDLILFIEPRFIRAIDENAAVRKTHSINETVYAERGRRLLNFLLEYENLPFYEVFESYMNFTNVDDVLSQIDLEDLGPDVVVDEELATRLCIAILLAATDSYDEATLHVEKIITALLDDDTFTFHNYRILDLELRKYFDAPSESGEGDEQS
jgi:hypothetical protein